MQVKIFKPSDVQSLHKWQRAHGMPQSTDIPIRTFTVPGVAIAGIRSVEGGLWLMDSLITNPLVSAQTRHAALQSLYAYITNSYSPIVGLSLDAGAIERAKLNGFEQLPYTVLRYVKPA